MQAYFTQLLAKLENKTATIGVIGLGYVGLPLAVEKAKAGYHVIGFDVQAQKVEQVNQGINYIGDVIEGELKCVVKDKKLVATVDYSKIKEVDAVAICVPTPLDKHQQPDTSYVENSAQEIAKYIKKGTLVVLESTTYPGTTEEIIQPILEETGLKCGQDLFIAYSPERVDPGNKQYKTKNTPKVVGGVTKKCGKLASTLYGKVLNNGIKLVSSPKVAEMEKIFENTFRHVNIALVNEMAILCDKMGIDVWEVIDAAKTKPYGFMPFYPGPGLGGHCIPIDPFYLTWKAREYNYHTKFIELAGEINNSMPLFVVEKAWKVLNKHGKTLNKAKILLLGVAYKKDIDDLRESPALKVIEHLEEHGAKITYNDPYIPNFTYKNKEYTSQPLTEELLQSADIVIITTDHSDYDYDFIAEQASLIFDTRNATQHVKERREKIYKI